MKLIEERICIVTIFTMLLSLLSGQRYDNSLIHSMSNNSKSVQYTRSINEMKQIEITTSLIHSEFYNLFLKKPPLDRKIHKQKTYEVGDTLTFSVRNLFNQSEWDKVPSELIFDTTTVSIWIETKSKDSLFTPVELSTIINEIKSYLYNQSGTHSVDSASGIMSILHDYFGETPDVDMDGKLDILLLDIRDTFFLNGSYVAGFFDPNDLLDTPTSNRRDLIYIDLYPTIKYTDLVTPERAIPTLAHEYQHLIHANYEGPNREYIFINEGLSELAEIVCGFPPRSPDEHFMNPARSLVSWNFDDPLPDYSRASLWTHYFFEQIGYEHIGELVQSSSIGLEEYEKLCLDYAGISLNGLFTNWLIAQTVNDITINTEYGYSHPQRSNIHQEGKQIIEELPSVSRIRLGKLSAFPIEIPLVSQYNIYSSSSASIHTIETYPNNSTVIDLNNSSGLSHNLTKDGNGSALVWISNNDFPVSEDDNSKINVEYLVSGKKSGIPVVFSYDDGNPDVFINQASYLLIEPPEAIAIRYEFESTSWLEGIEVNTIFLSEVQGSGVSDSVPRNIIVQILEDDNGIPGQPITPEISHIFSRPLGNLKPEVVSLKSYYSELSNISGSFFIMIKNDNDDTNYFAVGMDSSAHESETLFYSNINQSVNFSWLSFDNVPMGSTTLAGWNAMCGARVIRPLQYESQLAVTPQITFDFSLVKMVINAPFELDTAQSKIAAVLPSGNFYTSRIAINRQNIQAEFPLEIGGEYSISTHLVRADNTLAIDTVLVWEPPVPNSFSVSQNYPNPFNSSTSLPYIVMESGIIEIKVFDILGREVFRADPFPVEPGVRNFRINLNRLSSSIYFTKINYSRTRDKKKSEDIVKMTLIK